jgi:hypothetical protein
VGGHSLEKAMNAASFNFFRLIGSFHILSSKFFKYKVYQVYEVMREVMSGL